MITAAAFAVFLILLVWLYRRDVQRPRLTGAVATRYLLSCVSVFLLSLISVGDPLLAALWPWALAVSMLSFAGLILVLVGELCQS